MIKTKLLLLAEQGISIGSFIRVDQLHAIESSEIQSYKSASNQVPPVIAIEPNKGTRFIQLLRYQNIYSRVL